MLKRFAWIGAVLMFSSFLAASPAFAQRNQRAFRDSAQILNRIMAEMKERLQLTEEQEAKVRPIIAEQMKKQRALRQKFQGQRNRDLMMSLRRDMEKLHKETEKHLEAVLTKEQMKAYQKMREEAAQRRRERMRRRFRR